MQKIKVAEKSQNGQAQQQPDKYKLSYMLLKKSRDVQTLKQQVEAMLQPYEKKMAALQQEIAEINLQISEIEKLEQ